MDNPKYDIVVIGAGLAGMLCATILAKEGKRVAIVEQNKQLGGCLQTFSFDKKVFDSCVHYIGAMEPGQTQNRIFKYVGILDDLCLKKLDEDCFDEIVFGNETAAYPQAQGLANFQEQLALFFPDQAGALKQYTNTLERFGNAFPLYNLKNGDGALKEQLSWRKMNEMLANISNQKLQSVLTGNNLLYAGTSRTPFYVHALVTKSYIDSAFKFKGGSSQITKLLLRQFRNYGGTIYKSEKVCQLNTENGKVTSLKTLTGLSITGSHFIANVHPTMVLDWVNDSAIKPAYRKRISGLENSISAFMVNIVLVPGKVPYRNRNTYWNQQTDTLLAIDYQREDWPANYALYFGEDEHHTGYADTAAILTYMHAEEFAEWQQTHNRTAQTSDRVRSYQEYKEERAVVLVNKVAERFPEIAQYTKSQKIATPLTFRDYMGSPDGSMYGIMPNVESLVQSRIPNKTKIPNLSLVGQNIGLHGVLGVSINAIACCGELLGLDYLLKKINKETYGH